MNPMVDATICIDQLLRAAKILEQSSIPVQLGSGLAAGQSKSNVDDQLLKSLYKLGEDYQQRAVTSKLRSIDTNSTGSSRRSSPTSMISSCPSSAPGSPICHPSFLVSSTICSTTSPNNASACSLDPRLQLPSIVSGSANAAAAIRQNLHVELELRSNGDIIGIPIPAIGGGSDASSHQLQHRSNRSSISSNASISTACSLLPNNVRQQSRVAHNELEKNRRANLRGYLNTLKLLLPCETDATRDTTLSLLTRARNYIQDMKTRKETLLIRRDELVEENRRLQEALDTCTGHSSAPLIDVAPLSAGASLVAFGSAPSAFSPVSSQPSCGIVQPPSLVLPSPPAEQSVTIAERLMKMSLEELLMEGLLPAPSMLPLLYPYSSYAVRTALKDSQQQQQVPM